MRVRGKTGQRCLARKSPMECESRMKDGISVSKEWWQGWGWGCDSPSPFWSTCVVFPSLMRYSKSRDENITCHRENLDTLKNHDPGCGSPKSCPLWLHLTWGEVLCNPDFLLLNVGRVSFRSIPQIPWLLLHLFRELLTRSGLQICTWWAEVRSWCLAFGDLTGWHGWRLRSWRLRSVPQSSPKIVSMPFLVILR